jgi:large subunit ribosomal protein L10
MSKFVKSLVSDDIKKRLQNVNDALLVNMIGMNSSSTFTLRKELRAKKISVLVVKNSLAAQATAGTPLAKLMDGVAGSAAICWGSDDIVALAKSITEIRKSDKFPAFQPRGGVMDGERISADQIAEVAKWPSRTEQLGLVVGQILSVGSRVSSQLIAVGGALASQISEKAKGAEEESATDGAVAPAAATSEAVPSEAVPSEAVPSEAVPSEVAPPAEGTPAA